MLRKCYARVADSPRARTRNSRNRAKSDLREVMKEWYEFWPFLDIGAIRFSFLAGFQLVRSHCKAHVSIGSICKVYLVSVRCGGREAWHARSGRFSSSTTSLLSRLKALHARDPRTLSFVTGNSPIMQREPVPGLCTTAPSGWPFHLLSMAPH